MSEVKFTRKTVFDVKNFIAGRLDHETGIITMWFHGIPEPLYIHPEDESHEVNKKWIEGINDPATNGQSK